MNTIAWMIVGCEIAFWVFIISGLTVRYIGRRPAAGMILLALTPVVDVVLLLLTGWDLLYHNSEATVAHGIAAVYIGVSIAFGKRMIRWADERFRYYVTKEGPRPAKLYGLAQARDYMGSWLMHLLAYAIGCGLLLGLTYLIDDASRTAALDGILRIWSVVLGIDFVIALTYFLWPRRSPGEAAR